MDNKTFVDFYQVLGLSPAATADAIEQRFRRLVRAYHPDNQTTGDRSLFDAVVEAHETLRDPDRRARYHEDNAAQLPPLPDPSAPTEAQTADRWDAEEQGEPRFFHDLGIGRDAATQSHLLMMLYVRRRSSPGEPGMGNAELERLSGCPPEHMDFHLWYLRAKGWVSTGEDGLMAVTVDGVDRAAALYQEQAAKLITDRSV